MSDSKAGPGPHSNDDEAPGSSSVDEGDEERSPWKQVLDFALPLLVLALGAGGVWLLKVTAPSAERVEAQSAAPRVETVAAEAFADRPVVDATGTVRAVRRARVAPRVRGAVVWTSPKLAEGGHFVEGEPLLRLDPTDYRLAIQRQQSAIDRAELAITRVRNQQTVAERSWNDIAPEAEATSESGRALALYEPQLKSAEAELASARAALRQARVNLRRTQLEAPFDAVVMRESVDVGQIAGPSAPVATLVGTEALEVHASVPTDALPRLRLPVPEPGAEVPDRGSPARVTVRVGGETIGWDGHVDRVLPDVEEGTSLARVAVVVPDPFGFHREEGPREIPLLVGSFVHAAIATEPFDEAVTRVPRAALRGADRLWVSEDDTLRIREVDIVWQREESLLVRGIEPEAKVVLGPIATPVDGMDIRTR